MIGLRNSLIDNPKICRMNHAPNALCPSFKQLFDFMCNPVSRSSQLRDTATELGSKETFLKTWSSVFKQYCKD